MSEKGNLHIEVKHLQLNKTGYLQSLPNWRLGRLCRYPVFCALVAANGSSQKFGRGHCFLITYANFSSPHHISGRTGETNEQTF